jgi:hypothetical protein
MSKIIESLKINAVYRNTTKNNIINIFKKYVVISDITFENFERHKKKISKRLLLVLKTKATYIRAFQILRSDGARSLIVHVQLFIQNQIQEKYEFGNTELSQLVLNENKPSLLKIVNLNEREIKTNLPNWDLLSCNFNNFKIYISSVRYYP